MHPRRLTYCNIYFWNYEIYVIICNQSHIAYTVDYYSWVRDGAKSRGSDLKKRNWCSFGEADFCNVFFIREYCPSSPTEELRELLIKTYENRWPLFALEFFFVYLHTLSSKCFTVKNARVVYTIAYRRWTYILLTYVYEQKHSQNIEHEKIKNNYFAIGTNI